MSREPELARRLRGAWLPDEAAAEERSWDVVRAAYAERTPITPTYRARHLGLALAGCVAALAIGLSPAGAKVSDWVRDVVGEEEAKPQLSTLPAAGEILVEADNGVWIVDDDGSKRRLGSYDEATWSPHGRYVAAAAGDRLTALDPTGDVQWEITAPATVHDPRWTGTEFDTRIAYRSGGDLWVVAGDGTGARVVARRVAPVAPAWRPLGDTKLAIAGAHVVTYVDRNQRVRAVDVDTGRALPSTPDDLDLVVMPDRENVKGRARSPIAGRTAIVRSANGHAKLILSGDRAQSRDLPFSGPGRLTGPTWSPDGRWILIGWRDADQWLFINAERPRRVVAFDDITEQFDQDETGNAGFPRVAGWVLPAR